MKTSALFLLLGAAGLLGGSLPAQDAPLTVDWDYISVKSGPRLKGHLVSYDAQEKRIEFRTEDGELVSYTLDQLEPRSVFHLASSHVKADDGPGQLAVGNYARDHQLYAYAVTHYERAVKADPSLKPQVDKEMAKLRPEAAEWLWNKAQEAINNGNPRDAERYLTVLVQRLPNQPQTEKAKPLLAKYYDQNKDEVDKEWASHHDDQARSEIKTAKQYYDQLAAENKAGLQNSNSQTRAIDSFTRGVEYGKKALEELDRVTKDNKDPKVVAAAKELHDQTVQLMVTAYINLSNVYTTRSSYEQANAAINEALALDPNNANALRARSQNSTASAVSGSGWGWGAAFPRAVGARGARR